MDVVLSVRLAMNFHRAAELVLHKSGRMLVQLTPYLVLGVIAGELLRYTRISRLLERVCSRSPLVASVLAAVLGVVSPLCTYGTVPVVLQLYRAGVPLAPLVTFLSASSLMNPQLFILTWGGIGPAMALARAGAVLTFAVLLGALLHHVPIGWMANAKLRDPERIESEPAADRPAVKPFEVRRFLRKSYDHLLFVTYYLVLGILLGSAVEVFVPARWIAVAFQPGKWASVALAAVMGVPLYACGGGAIPLIRKLIDQGMSEGAALAFFIAGPATRITPLLALGAILRPRFIGAYVVGLLGYALTAGMLYEP